MEEKTTASSLTLVTSNSCPEISQTIPKASRDSLNFFISEHSPCLWAHQVSQEIEFSGLKLCARSQNKTNPNKPNKNQNKITPVPLSPSTQIPLSTTKYTNKAAGMWAGAQRDSGPWGRKCLLCSRCRSPSSASQKCPTLTKVQRTILIKCTNKWSFKSIFYYWVRPPTVQIAFRGWCLWQGRAVGFSPCFPPFFCNLLYFLPFLSISPCLSFPIDSLQNSIINYNSLSESSWVLQIGNDVIWKWWYSYLFSSNSSFPFFSYCTGLSFLITLILKSMLYKKSDNE